MEVNVPMKNKPKWKLVWILLGIGALLSVGFFVASKNSPVSFLESVLPPGAKIEELYSEDLSINGDYLVAAKIAVSSEGFECLVRRLDLKLKSYSNINPMIERSSLDWWQSLEQSEGVFFKSGERFQIWMYYRDGLAFYCDRGW